MPSRSTRFQRLLAAILPVLYGTLMALSLLMALLVCILFYEHHAAQAQTVPAAAPPQPLATVKPSAPVQIPGPALPPPAPSPPPREAPRQVQKAPAPDHREPREWVWTPLRDEVASYFRIHVPELGLAPLLQYAVMLDDEEWISELAARGADVGELTPSGDTLLCLAVRLGAVGSVRALLHAGADWRQPGLEKQPPLQLASLRRGADIYRALLAAGADPNTRFQAPVTRDLLARVTIKDLRHALENDRGVTPLSACAARGDVEGAAELLRWGASPARCTTRHHRYPINFAATQGYLFLMRIILGRQPESEPEMLITVDLTRQRAWLTQEGKIIDTCPVSTGREGYNTPAGRYVITDKHRSWTSTLYHVAMPFFMRLNCSAIGLHSGYVTGRPASHGCIRLPYDKAQKFFSLCKVGDEVQILH